MSKFLILINYLFYLLSLFAAVYIEITLALIYLSIKEGIVISLVWGLLFILIINYFSLFMLFKMILLVKHNALLISCTFYYFAYIRRIRISCCWIIYKQISKVFVGNFSSCCVKYRFIIILSYTLRLISYYLVHFIRVFRLRATSSLEIIFRTLSNLKIILGLLFDRFILKIFLILQRILIFLHLRLL